MLVGGDTAYSVLTGLKADSIAMKTEVQPGISIGAVVGGEASSKLVVTKAGGFGDDDTLVRVCRYLRELRDHPPGV